MFKQFYTWLSTGTITADQIRRIKAYLNDRYTENPTDKEDLIRLLEDPFFSCGVDQKTQAQGLAWLKNLCYTSKGNTRRRCPLGPRELEIIADFSHFKLVGFYNNPSGFVHAYNYNDFYPRYAVYDTVGNSFVYTAYSYSNNPGILVLE